MSWEKKGEDRAAHIKGLHDLADWLEANPNIPIGANHETTLQYSIVAYGTWKYDFPAACRELDRVAALIGEDVTDLGEPGSGWRKAKRCFGPVSYQAVAIERKAEPDE